MSDVNVNIRGRDDGLGQNLDSLRQKAVALGRDLSDLNDWESKTDTQKRQAVTSLGEGTMREQQQAVRREFDSLRQSNSQYFQEQKDRLKKGEISPKEFDKFQSEFNFDQSSLRDQESDELLNIEREMNQSLKAIYKELTDASKIEREIKQRDREEFRDNGGLQGQILNENRNLRRQQFLANSEEEIAALQAKIDANNKELASMKRPNDGSGGGGGNDFLMAAGAAGSGDMMGAIGGGLRGAGQLTGAVKAFTIAGIIAMIVKETLGHGDKLREAVAPTAAFRGGYSTGSAFNDAMRNGFNDRFDIGAIGMDNEEFAANMRDKALTSGISGGDLKRRTFEDAAFEKAFGASSAIFSEFERFAVGQEEATTIALDVMNVLSSIEASSLKSSDLTTLTEKLASQQTILSLQRQKRDSVDNDAALRMLAAFESVGLSGKGERASGFINQTIQGLGEGGSDIEMMLKIEAAKRANPDLINDPAGLRRKVRFNPDDPKYMAEFFKMAGKMTGGNQMAMDDLLMSFFDPESEADMDMYEKLMAGGDSDALLRGRGLGKMKQRKSTLDKTTMVTDAESGVGVITEALKDFSNQSQSMIDLISSSLKDVLSGNAVNVNVLTDKTKKAGNTSQVVGPKAKSGR